MHLYCSTFLITFALILSHPLCNSSMMIHIFSNKIKYTFVLVALTLLAPLSSFGKTVLGIEGEKSTSVGIYIKDLRTGKIIVDQESERCMTPASVTKAYTSASAMSLLDKNFRFETKVYLSGEKGETGIWNGNLVIKASGDPTLESEHFPGNQGFISQIIDALKARNISRINGDIVLERVVEDRQYAEGAIDTWCINDVPRTFGAGIFDFNWCDNYFGLYPATGNTTSPVPDLKYRVWHSPWDNGLDMIRGVYSDSLIISGKGYDTNTKARVTTTMPYPFSTFRSRLITRLEKENISVTKKASETSGRSLLVNHRSPVLDDILKSLMVRSDNMFAEGMLRVLGNRYGDRNASLHAETALWKDRGLTPGYNRILDGSGLSRANAISPRFLASVLEWMAKSDMSERYVALFPIAGISGTMKSFMADTRFKGRLAFKTGSLNAVQCYAGYVIDDDKKPTHVVVIMINNFFCQRADLKQAISKFLLEKLEE